MYRVTSSYINTHTVQKTGSQSHKKTTKHRTELWRRRQRFLGISPHIQNIHTYITPGLKSLHWLPVEKRIVFKLCLLVYKTWYCLAPLYLCGLLIPYAPARRGWEVATLWLCPEHGRRHMGIASSLLLLQCSGISFQIASGGKRAWRLSRFHL